MNAHLSTIDLHGAGGLSAGARRNTRGALVIAVVVSVVLMFVPYSDYVLYPFRLFVTFIHESGHAMAGILTGGAVQSLTVRPDTSGVTMVQSPTWALGIVFSAGYLGAALFGALLLQVGRIQRWKDAGRAALYAASVYILVVTVLWTFNPLHPFTNGFTLVTGLLLAAGLWLLARFSTARAADFIAAFLAVQCCLNSLQDLRVLLNITANNAGDNDAVFMSQHYPMPPTFWALLWAIIAVGMLVVSLRSYLRATSMKPASAGLIASHPQLGI